MTFATYSLAAFALLNFARVIAYVPQIVRIHRDANGASSVSITTWALFTGANVATVTYATAAGASPDYLIAFVFSLNAIGCGSIASLTAWKRLEFVRRARRSRSDFVPANHATAQGYPLGGGAVLQEAA